MYHMLADFLPDTAETSTADQDTSSDTATEIKEINSIIDELIDNIIGNNDPSGFKKKDNLEIIEFMDKLCSCAGKDMLHKPAAAVTSARRAGTTATLDVIMKYFTYHQMPVVSSNYWTMVHGNTPDEVQQDAEGIQIMRTLGNNMAWLLKCLEAGKKAGIELPVDEEKIKTNFIR